MDAYDHLIEKLELSERGRAFYDAAGMQLRLRLVEDSDGVIVEEILVTPQGTGLGSRVVEELQRYADESGKLLEVSDARNVAFWAKWSIPQI